MVNNTTAYDLEEVGPRDYGDHSVWTIVSLSIVYGLLSLTAFVGNTLVIWVIYCGRRMHTVMNIYISNLALADIIIAAFCIPFQFQAALLNRWDLPAFMCKLCPFLQHLSINCSIFTLVVIALDRYRGILWPLKGGYSKFRAKIHLAIVWLLGTTIALPNLVLFHVADHPEQKGKYGCIIDMDLVGEKSWRMYTLAVVLVQYCIPLTIITFCHCHMAKVLWGTKTPGQANDQRDEVILANKRKVTKMLSIVVLLFGFCWLPFQTFNFLYSIKVALSFDGVNYVWMACHILAMSNSCCNPFIYGIYNNKFREELDRKYGSLWGKPRQGTTRQNATHDEMEMQLQNGRHPPKTPHSEDGICHVTNNPGYENGAANSSSRTRHKFRSVQYKPKKKESFKLADVVTHHPSEQHRSPTTAINFVGASEVEANGSKALSPKRS